MKWLRKYLERIKLNGRPFRALQIEPTSRCQLKCIMCPRTIFRSEWKSGDMPLSTYLKLSENFDRVENIHLQGWGEPLLNPHIFEMIRIAKERNCEVSLTTSGFNLTRENSERLAKEGLDILAVSIAGATKETHELIRCGSNFEHLLENIEVLSAIKERMKIKTPKIVVSFLMTGTNIEELPDLVNIVKDRGGNELVATNLDYTLTTVLDELRAFSCSTVKRSFKIVTDRAIQKAKKMHLPFRIYPLEMEEVIMCEMNPLRIVFITHDGCISPCVYLNMTKQGLLQRVFCGSSSEVQRVCFGNAGEQDFMDVWENSDYQDFRKTYDKRLSTAGDMYRDIIIDVASTEKLKETEKAMEESLMKNPVPEVCKTCYKAYGI